MKRREFIKGAAALAAYSQLKKAEALTANQKLTVLGTVRPWWVQPGAVVDLDFFNQRAWPLFFTSELADTRASVQTVPNANGSLFLAGSGTLSRSNAYLEIEPAGTNKCTNFNANPTDTTGLSGGGVASTTVVDDTAALASAGLSSVCTSGKVFKVDNSGGGSNIFINVIGPTGDVNKHSFSLYWRGGNGAIDAGANAPAGVTGTAGYARVKLQNITPSSSSSNPFIRVDAGQVVFFILNQFEENPASTSVIPVSGAAAARAANAATLQRTGVGRSVLTFDDNSQQTISGITLGSQWTIPTNINRSLLKRLTGYAS